MKKFLLVFALIAVIFAIVLSGCGENDEVVPESTAVTEIPTETTTEDPLTLNPSLTGIATKYGDLLYPKRWNEQVRTNVTEKDGISTVEMYATVGEHEEMHIYDVLFDGNDGVCIGAVMHDGEKIYVNLVSYDTELDDTWTEDERLTLMAIKEDINYLIDSLN